MLHASISVRNTNLVLIIVLTLLMACKSKPAAEAEPADMTAVALNAAVRFEFANPVAENEAEGIVTHQLYLYEGDKKYDLGRVTGGVEVLAKERFAEFGIPATALAAVTIHYGGDTYYYAIREEGSLKFYNGGPYMDETGAMQYEWQKGEPLLLGRWENKEQPEFWVFYDIGRFYSDGNEEGTAYEIKNNSITFDDIENKIVKLTATELVTQTAEGTTTTWVKADMQ